MSHHPSRLSLIEVARGAAMSPQNLRKTYLNKGKLTVCHDAQGKPYVEMAECLRVFPNFILPGASDAVAGNPVAIGLQQLQQQVDAKDAELKTLRERLQSEAEQRRNAEEREAWLRNHVDKLTQENLALIAAPPAPAKKSGWFARLVGR